MVMGFEGILEQSNSAGQYQIASKKIAILRLIRWVRSVDFQERQRRLAGAKVASEVLKPLNPSVL